MKQLGRHSLDDGEEPWNRGRKLPTNEDCNRIIALTPKAYATSGASIPKGKARPAAVAKTLRESGSAVRSAEPATGYVQLRRMLAEADWRITMSNESVPLGNYVAAGR
jgi:hypothetical protein